MNKGEYKKLLKRLIKKYHPDLSSNNSEITKILVGKLNELKVNDNIEKQNLKDKIIKEPATTVSGAWDYFYYKLGIKYYRNIHPNKFYKRNEDSTFETRTYDELISVLNKIYLSFDLSEYYFNKIITEYPQSVYYEDAKAKIKLLKKLFKSYKDMALEENKIINNEKFISEMGLKILRN